MNPYMYMWEFHVKESMTSAFEEAYGPNGEWVRLFRKDKNYIRTELHKDINNKGRYVTLDYWTSQEACINFREKYKKEFAEVDEKCELLTLKEISLGSFTIIK
ncbi:MAG: antibiotic biosynthesis monooxygenase [Bacteroidetes bacterium]|nr:antibiotic biosynthesis monooxygenase [Bacteroidota bacterium]